VAQLVGRTRARLTRVGVTGAAVVAAVALWCGVLALASIGMPAVAATAMPTATGGASVPPSPGATASPQPSVTPTGEPSAQPSIQPTTQPSASASPSPQPTVSPTPSPTATPAPPAPPVLQPVPPAVESRVGVGMIVAAVLVILGSLLVVLVIQRRSAARDADAGLAAGASPESLPEALGAMEAVGERMLDAAYPVGEITEALEDMASAYGHPDVSVVAFPTALIVSALDGTQHATAAVTATGRSLSLIEVDALDRLVHAARGGHLAALEAWEGARALDAQAPTYGAWARIGSYTALCGALAALLGATWSGMAFAALLGAVVGSLQQVTAGAARRFQALITVADACGVAVAVFLAIAATGNEGLLPALIAPLVVLLPGALLTTGVMELASGHMMAGAGRLAAGAMQLMLLAVGVVAGAALVGVPEVELGHALTAEGSVAPWIAVAVFGVTIVINRGGRLRSIPWILLVLYVAYGAQVLGSVVLGGVLSAMVGAFAMTPVAMWVARHPTGPAARVSFLPAFWMLVPGSLGLVGVTSLVGGQAAGLSTVMTMAATMIAITLGILAGSAVGVRRWPSGAPKTQSTGPARGMSRP